jgi:hypothetical protein
MKPASPSILTINGGSSSIKFALFEAGDSCGEINLPAWSVFDGCRPPHSKATSARAI